MKRNVERTREFSFNYFNDCCFYIFAPKMSFAKLKLQIAFVTFLNSNSYSFS